MAYSLQSALQSVPQTHLAHSLPLQFCTMLAKMMHQTIGHSVSSLTLHREKNNRTTNTPLVCARYGKPCTITRNAVRIYSPLPALHTML